MRKGRDGHRTIISLPFTLFIWRTFILVMFGNGGSQGCQFNLNSDKGHVFCLGNVYLSSKDLCTLWGSNISLAGCRMRIKNRGGMTEILKAGCGIKTVSYQRDLLKYFVQGMQHKHLKITRYRRYARNCHSNLARSGQLFWVVWDGWIEPKIVAGWGIEKAYVRPSTVVVTTELIIHFNTTTV